MIDSFEDCYAHYGTQFVETNKISSFGLQPVESWLQSLDATEYRPILSTLFDKYVGATMEHCRQNFKTIVPLPAINQAKTVCKILEGILPKVSLPICTYFCKCKILSVTFLL